MLKYYLDKHPQHNGDYQVHHAKCKLLPAAENRTALGVFTSCIAAVTLAKESFSRANGCIICSNLCHFTIQED